MWQRTGLTVMMFGVLGYLMAAMLMLPTKAQGMPSQVINLVPNPGFEAADAIVPTQPAGFTPGRVGTGRKAALTWENPGHVSGKCVAVETMDSDDLGYWETVIAVKPRTEYVLSFYYKCRSAVVPKTTAGDPEYNKGRPGGPNLELGMVPDDPDRAGEPTRWSDIEITLPPQGGVYLPVASQWSLHRRTFVTRTGQTKLRIKLRVWCYAQKVWFDDLSVVETATLPRITLRLPAADAVVADGRPHFRWRNDIQTGPYLLAYSSSPIFDITATKQHKVDGDSYHVAEALPAGRWFWRLAVPDQHRRPCWIADGTFLSHRPSWTDEDTTPPLVYRPEPTPNDNAGVRPVISARFAEHGSGIDLASAKVLLDGRDVTADANVQSHGVTLTPAAPLAKGLHRVRISVADKAGNAGNMLVWQFGVGQFLSNKSEYETEPFRLNGDPFFPIGIYAYVCHPDDGRFNFAALAAATDAGYNFVLNTTERRVGLDKEAKAGIMAALNMSADMGKIDDPATAEETLFVTGQGRFRDHPSIFAYWADDPENIEDTAATPVSESTIAKLNISRQTFKKNDPDRPTLFAISNLPRLDVCVPAGDVMVAYRYPVPQYHPMMIYGWTIVAFENAVRGSNKPIWFNSQAIDLGHGAKFSADEGMRPNPAEIRAMAFYSLVLGVKGYTIYANYLNPRDYPGRWAEALRIATMMRHLGPALAVGTTTTDVSIERGGAAGSIFFRNIRYEGGNVLLAVNMSADRVAARWVFPRPVRASVLFEDRRMPAPATQAADHFEPFGVHVYQWQ